MKGQISSVKGSLLPTIFMLYTRKINLIFSDIQNRIFDFEVAALDMMNFEWSYIFPRSRIDFSFCCLLHFSWRYSRNKMDS